MNRAGAIAVSLIMQVGIDAASGPIPTFDELLVYLRLNDADRTRVLRGEIVGRDMLEDNEKELAVTVVTVISAPLPRVVEEVRKGELLHADQEVIDFRLFGPEALLEEVFHGIGYASGEEKEVRELLAATAGSTFNLSPEELDRMRALRTRFAGAVCERDVACVAEVSGAYRQILLARMAKYQSAGLDGIAPYARGVGALVRPDEEMRDAADDAELVRRAFPEFYRAFTLFPKEQGKQLDNQFLWIKRRVQGRPAFALAHRLYDVRPDMVLIAERQFYVGTSYNSLQTFIGLLPDGDRTLLVYTNRTFTDQAAGVGSGVRHAVGRKKLLSAVTASFEALRARVR